MNLPFTREQFLAAFADYNEAVWPMQIGLNALAVAVIMLIVIRRGHSDRAVCAILGALWAWIGIVYHLLYFRGINPAATFFSIAFLAGSAAFVWAGVIRGQLQFVCSETAHCAIGYALIVYAMLVYPMLSALLGHEYPAIPTFGLPCPTTIFTIGVLAFVRPPYPRYVLVVPLAWAFIGSQAAWLLGVYQDLGLMAAGFAGIFLVWRCPPRVRHA